MKNTIGAFKMLTKKEEGILPIHPTIWHKIFGNLEIVYSESPFNVAEDFKDEERNKEFEILGKILSVYPVSLFPIYLYVLQEKK